MAVQTPESGDGSEPEHGRGVGSAGVTHGASGAALEPCCAVRPWSLRSGLMSLPRRSSKRLRSLCGTDPDPLILSVLTEVLAVAVAGLLIKSAASLYGRGGRQDALRSELKQHLDSLLDLIDRVERLVGSERRMEMGGVLLLTAEQLEEFKGLREEIFRGLRGVDEVATKIPVEDLQASPSATRRLRKVVPPTFRDLSKLVKQTLRRARTAATAGSLFAQVRVAVEAMRQMAEQLERRP